MSFKQFLEYRAYEIIAGHKEYAHEWMQLKHNESSNRNMYIT